MSKGENSGVGEQKAKKQKVALKDRGEADGTIQRHGRVKLRDGKIMHQQKRAGTHIVKEFCNIS